MEKLVLDKWQKNILKTEGNIALRAGRQVGKSTVISMLAGDYAAQNPNKTIMIVAAVERQAFLLFEKVLWYLQDTYKEHIKNKGKDKPTKSRVRLKNGSVIYCLPTGLTGYGIRGYTIDLLIADEAAFIEDAVFDAVVPSLAARSKLGARIILLSTPFGRDTPDRPNYFARCFKDKTFTTFHVSSEDCPRITKEFLEHKKETMSKRAYQQEFMGEFVDDLMQFFPDAIIKACMKRSRSEARECFVGMDIARMGDDETVWAIGGFEGEKLIHRDLVITKKTMLSDTINTTIHLDKIWDFEKILLDDEGIGVGVSDVLLDTEQTKRKIVPINNSKRLSDYKEDKRVKLLKEDLYFNLLVMMEQNKIELLDEPEVFYSLKSIQFDYVKDSFGKTHFKIFGSYSHICEALIRLAYCRKYKELNIWIKSI